MKNLYVAYSRRSCVTGKAIFDKLKKDLGNKFSIRRTISGDTKKRPDLVIRFGNSSLHFDGFQINNREAVKSASDKWLMISALSKCDDVSIPKLHVGDEMNNPENEMMFYRNSLDNIEFRSYRKRGDKYALSAIDKVIEYRVHVFDNKIYGVYQKNPNADGVYIYKNENCDFKRLDMSDRDTRKSILGVRPMAKSATKALGLTFAGVDVIKDKEGRIYVLEVNSSPSLNGPNLDRFCEMCKEFIDKNYQENAV